MPWDILIRNATLVTSHGEARLDCAIEDGKIVEIESELRGASREEIDANGLHVFPGVVDSHVHFNEPGRTDWEGFATGSSALVAGGGTSFFDMPLNSNPPTLDGESFDLKKEAGLKSSLVDFALWGGLTPKNLDRMEQLAERGVIGFKAFMCPSGIDEFPHADPGTLYQGMQIAAKLNLPVAVHAEEPRVLDKYRASVKGKGWIDYLASRPVVAEAAAINLAMQLAQDTGCSLHIVHVSSAVLASSIDFTRENRSRVTFETCPHYLLLNEIDLVEIGARAKCSPPVRDETSRQSLVDLLHEDVIDLIASDHSPAPETMKTGNDAFAIWGGIAGVQSTLPALLSLDPKLAPTKVAQLTSARVAERFRIPKKGQIETSFDADLALVDLNGSFELKRDDLLDRHKLSPYVGRIFRGKIVRTIARGRTVYRDGVIVGKPNARLLVPNRD